MTSPPPPDPLIGARFGQDGRLVVQRLIGEGGMGSVYYAWDELKGRPIALKFLNLAGASDPEVLTRFKREGQRCSQIRHPHVIRIHALGREKGKVFIASEFIEGRNLHQMVQEEGALSPDAALGIVRDAASGLGAAHAEGIVHRDLKPENVMVRASDGCVKVLDFGIAKDLDASVALTRLGTYVGTPGYSAPEQVMGKEVDLRADIYSLGTILYELITGEAAIRGGRVTVLLNNTVKGGANQVNRLSSEVARPLADLVDRMMRKSPRQRPKDTASVIARIDEVRQALVQIPVEEDRRGVAGFFKRLFEDA